MKKIMLFVLLISLPAAWAGAQKTMNDANAEKRNVSGYHAISVSGGIDLYLSPGSEAVAVSASETKFRDRIRTEVVDGVLKIWYDYDKAFHLDINRRMKAYVSFKSLDKLNASGGSDVSVDGSISGNSLALTLSGGYDFQGKVELSDLKVVANGGSDVNISGTAKNLDIDASGGSDFKGYELTTDVCNIGASGGSDVYITVNKELSAESSGGSDVFYKGNGTVKEMRSSGSSGIKKVSK
jgi:hypothetical protein